MGLLDKIPGVDKAKKLLGEHGDKVADGIDKAADMADEKTDGKYTERIDKAGDAAKSALDGLSDSDKE